LHDAIAINPNVAVALLTIPHTAASGDFIGPWQQHINPGVFNMCARTKANALNVNPDDRVYAIGKKHPPRFRQTRLSPMAGRFGQCLRHLFCKRMA